MRCIAKKTLTLASAKGADVLSSPVLFRAAIKTADTAVSVLPRAVLYNPLNVWGKHREVPEAPEQTFRDWFLKRSKK